MTNEAYFAYQIKNHEICILRCYAKISKVVIPETIDGLPVTEIAPYAFAKEMGEEPNNPGELPCICGELLEELVLPATVKRLGRYVFYNCYHFRELTFYTSIGYMGAGSFTGCKELCKLNAYEVKDAKSCIREILVDLNQTVTLQCIGEQKFCMMYPEFFEEAVENTPARIIETHTHGVGIQYRNAFANTRINFKEYDRQFEYGKYNMELFEAVYMAIFRLQSNVELEENAKIEYENFLREHLQKAVVILINDENIEILKWIAQSFVLDKSEMKILIDTSKNHAEAISILMDVSHRRFAKKKKGFSL